MCKKIWPLALVLIAIPTAILIGPVGMIHAETHLLPDTIISGSVEISEDGESWTAFSRNSVLKVGDSIRTGGGSAVSLKAEDGSMLYLEEQTLLKVTELTFSSIDRARIFRFHLEQGSLTAKAARNDTKANIFELSTNSVEVRLREQSDNELESSASIIVESAGEAESEETRIISASKSRSLQIAKTLPPIGTTGSLGASDDPFASRVQPLSGEIELEQRSTERTLVEIALGSGVDLILDQKGQKVNVKVDKSQKSVVVSTADHTTQGAVVASEKNNAIQLQNESSRENDTKLELKAGDLHCSISSDSSVQLTSSQDAGEQGFPIVLPPETTSAFAFSEESQTKEGPLQGNKVSITSISGGIQVNGIDILPGETLVSEIGDSDEGAEGTGEDLEGAEEGSEGSDQGAGETGEDQEEFRHEPPLAASGEGGAAGGGDPPPTPGPSPTESPGSPILP